MTEANRAAILAILALGLGAYAWHVGTLEHSGAVAALFILGAALVGVGVAVVQPSGRASHEDLAATPALWPVALGVAIGLGALARTTAPGWLLLSTLLGLLGAFAWRATRIVRSINHRQYAADDDAG